MLCMWYKPNTSIVKENKRFETYVIDKCMYLLCIMTSSYLFLHVISWCTVLFIKIDKIFQNMALSILTETKLNGNTHLSPHHVSRIYCSLTVYCDLQKGTDHQHMLLLDPALDSLTNYYIDLEINDSSTIKLNFIDNC